MGDLDEMPEDVESDALLEIPYKNDLDLGKELVFEFVSAMLPDEYDRVRDMFRGRGAYGRFKGFLAAKGLLEAWHAFENDRGKAALRRWCDEHDLKVVDGSETSVCR